MCYNIFIKTKEELFVELLIFIVVIFSLAYIKVVPNNTVVIIDRNSHYLKTKKHGLYFFNPKTDKVTTEISKLPLTRNYSNFFETDDGMIFLIDFCATYHTENIDDTLVSLKSARRSIYDIMNSSVYWATNNLNARDIKFTSSTLLYKETYEKLITEARTLNIIVDDFKITNIVQINNRTNMEPFKPHLNSYTMGPIRYN